uniref:Kinesin-like protein n=2 Tax=Parascaris univalens TaxID=6257 RepID=A0A914ZNN9_PARUN
MSDGESIVVAVRVRPFNEREKQRKAQLIIEMPDGKQTGIRDPNTPDEDPKWFSFDHSYWSHDGYKENASGYLEPLDDRYADQKKVFEDLGKGLLNNAWKVEDLLSIPVSSYEEIEQKMDEGTKQRTIAATDMNATSSRAHTIVKIQFNQKSTKSGGGTTTKSSQINLVDLAGSERQKDAHSEGDRLKEGIVINQSLSTLGRVIKALYEQQEKKKKGVSQIPYRDSILTSLLKNALGGNSKTVMIAALSPADINYEETLSTLRFADRAKSIKTKAIVNESATERMIRELKEENARLLGLIQKGVTATHLDAKDEVDVLKKQLEENQKEMERLQQTWQQRLDEQRSKAIITIQSDILQRRSEEPHLWNLNEDPALTDMIVYFIGKGEVKLGSCFSFNFSPLRYFQELLEDNNLFPGNKDAKPSADIQLNGLSIQPQHALFINKENKKVTLTPLQGAEVLVNGKPLHTETTLQSNDRIFFGGNHLYVFVNPNKKAKKNVKITYDMAQQEIARNSGLAAAIGGDANNKSTAELILEEDLINLLPNVYRANSMSKELNKSVNFEIILVSPEARGLADGLTEIWIKVYDSVDDTHFLWDKNRFMNRYYGMQEMYQNFMEEDNDWDAPEDRDPFYEPPESEILVGSSTVYLQSLAYLIEHEEQLPIFDFGGQDLGRLTIALTPCTTSGKEILGEYVEDPMELVGKNLSFKVKIVSAIGLPRRIDKSFCKYRFYDRPVTITSAVIGSNAAYAHETAFTYRPVTKELLNWLNFNDNFQLVNYLKEGSLHTTVWGTQKARKLSLRPAAPTPPKKRITKITNEKQRVQKLLDETQKINKQTITMRSVEKALNGAIDYAEYAQQQQGSAKEKTTKRSPEKSRRNSMRKAMRATSNDPNVATSRNRHLTSREEEKSKKKKDSTKIKKRSKSVNQNRHL